MVRLSAEELARLDAWIAAQKEKLGIELSRPAAIRARLNTSESAVAAKPRSQSRPSEAEGRMNVTQRRVLPLDDEAKLIFMKLPSRIRRSLSDLADAGGCSTLEIVRRFQEGAGHPGFPEPPPTAASIAQKTERGPAVESGEAAKSRRPAKAGSKT
jgi:hypothetical protein